MLPEEIVEKAADFHGHLGPFLIIGVRLGLAGLKKLGACDSKGLSVTASLPLRVPFSCIIDGIQVTTKCTVGNQKLLLIDSKKIQAEFRRKGKKRVVISLKDSALEKLRMQLRQEGTTDEQVRQMASKIAATPESDLFTIS